MRRNWFHRLLLSYLPVLILIVCLFAFIGIVQLNELSRKEAMKSSRVYVQNLQSSMDMTLRSIEMMAIETITRNTKLTAFAGMESEPAFIIELSQLLQSMVTTNTFIDSVYVYRTGDGTVLSDKTKLTIDSFADSLYIENVWSGSSPTGWSAPRKFRTFADLSDESKVISIAKSIPLQSKRIAMLVVNVKVTAIQEFFDKYGNSEVNQIEVVDGAGGYLFEPKAPVPRLGDATLASPYTGWTYHSALRKAELGNLYNYVTSGWFLFGFLGLLVGIVWVVYITRKNYKPIETMMSRIRKYNQQHKDHPIGEPPVDELTYIDYALGSMIEVTKDYRSRDQENREYRRLRLFQELIEGGLSERQPEREADLREMGIEGPGGASVSIIEIDKYRDFISEHSRNDQGLFKYILKKVVEETAKASALRIWQEWVTNHRLCVIYFGEPELHAGQRLLAQSEQVREWIQHNLKLTVTFGLGIRVPDAYALAQSYESAARALDYKSALGSNRVIGHWEIELLSHDDLFVYLQYVRTIAQAFRVGSDGWRDQLKLLFEGLRRLMLPKEEISGILTYMNYYFYREMMELPPDYQELWNREFRIPWDESMEALETLDELEAFYTDNLSVCASKMEAVRESKGNQGVVQKVREYIQANFSDANLSLSGLSDQFHMNASSLSTLFKEEFGEKFVVYLSQVRIEHAKELLRGTTLPIQEISEKVGYVHQMSFIRAFKKSVGTTPGDYRKAHQ